MIAGKMTEYVLLQRPSSTKDGFGSEIVTYTDYGTVHAEIVWKGGSTDYDVSELFSGERLEVIIRSAHPVVAKWRVTYAGTVYYVQAVEHNRVKGLRRLHCQKVND